MQVGVVIDEPNFFGGLGQWAVRLARWFRDASSDITVHILVPRQSSAGPDQSPDWLSAEDRSFIEFIEIPAPASARDRARLIADWLRHARSDIVAPNISLDGCVAATLLRAEGASAIGICHSDEGYHYRILAAYGFLWDGVVGVSRRCVAETDRGLRGRAPGAIHIPYGVPIRPRVVREPDASELRLIYVGRLTQRQKRVGDLVGLVAALRRRSIPFRLDIVGAGPERDSLAAALRGDATLVRFHGRLRYERVASLLDRAHCLVSTSEFEGTSIAMLEAMAAGAVPVVTAVRSGVDDVIEEGRTGRIVPIGAVEAMADAIQGLWRDRPALALMSAAAHERASDAYSLDRMGQRYRDLFLSLRTARRTLDTRTRITHAVAAHIEHAWRPALEPAESDLPSIRAAEVLDEIARRGEGPVLLYGAGDHTARIEPALRHAPAPIAGILDDDPSSIGQQRFGVRVWSVDDATATGARSVLVSSDEHEDAIWAKLADPKFRGFVCHRLYEDAPRFLERATFTRANERAILHARSAGVRRLLVVGAGFWSRVFWDLWRRYDDLIVVPPSAARRDTGRARTAQQPPPATVDALLVPHPDVEIDPPLGEAPIGDLTGPKIYRAIDFLDTDGGINSTSNQ